MSSQPNPPGVVDSPTPWVAEHIKNYDESGGEQGHEWNGVPTLLISVRGRKSGTWHRTALIYGRSGEDYVIVASKGGDPQHPQWYLNLVANPDVRVQAGAETFDATARVAEGEERTRLWDVMAQIWPDYNSYKTRTDRQIPVVVLEPAK